MFIISLLLPLIPFVLEGLDLASCCYVDHFRDRTTKVPRGLLYLHPLFTWGVKGFGSYRTTTVGVN